MSVATSAPATGRDATIRSVINATGAAVADNPDSALALFRVTGEGGDGVRTAIRIGRHAVLVDEPPDPGGEDAAPNPVEAPLAGLLSCQVVTCRRLHATVDEHCRLAAIARDDRGEADVRGDPTPPASAS